jgi:signal transduction histidine kinase
MAVTPEVLIPRLGDVLVEQGKITTEQLTQALEKQKEARLQGQSPLIGQVLVEMGFLDEGTLNSSITQQILILQNNLRQANETLEKKVQERTAEQEVAYQKLSELDKLKVNFVSNISHELRTPLTHILGYVELMLAENGEPLSANQRQSLLTIRKATNRLERLIDDLILFSTSETNNLVIVKESFNPEQLASAVFERNLENAAKKNVTLRKRVEIEHKSLSADQRKLTWVVNHLIDNAIKFTNPGGEILLAISEKTHCFLFSVQDNGIGIDPSKQEEIFDLFHQLDGSSTRAQGGTGLGLALIKRILIAHESEIHVDSQPGRGSRFWFSICKE